MSDAALLDNNVVYLKQQLREKENALRHSHQKLNEQQTRLKETQDQLKSKNDYIVRLEELIKQFQRKQYSASSEKVSPDQLGLFNEAESIECTGHDTAQQTEADTVDIRSHQRSKKPRVSIPADLPREAIVYDLADDQKICPHDGTVLKNIGSEDHEQLDIVPAQIKVLKHIRKKYACPCCQTYVVTAGKPKQPIEKSIASPSLLATVATNKYCDALPLYRQSEIFNRLGIHLDRTNLANWMVKSGQLIQPLINLLQDRLLEQPVIHMDETPLQVLNEPGKAAQSNSYMWVMATQSEQPVRLFHYAPTRSQSIPLILLNENSQAIMVDGYEGYQAACHDYTITRLGCWAHVRRKFVEAKKLQPKGKSGKADQAIAFIQKLYRIEQQIKDQPLDERDRIRQCQAKPIIDKIKRWLEKSLPHVPPKTALGKALHYLHQQWPRLIGYVENGAYPIDNNPAENAIRPFVIGRKNWLFSNSQAGAKASANLYSLIETAKANGLNPYDYLKYVFKELPNAHSVEDVENLLPWNYKLMAENL
jgi:transposase